MVHTLDFVIALDHNNQLPALYYLLFLRILKLPNILPRSFYNCILCNLFVYFCWLWFYCCCFASVQVHSHSKRATHRAQPLKVPAEFTALQDHCSVIPRLYMELFAVVCIATSHYVAFVKGGPGPDAPWVFFDSMADRKGANCYCILIDVSIV